MYVTGVAIIAALLTQAQDNLNRYWDRVPNATAEYMRIGAGEWILVILGAAGWADALLALFVESYRTL